MDNIPLVSVLGADAVDVVRHYARPPAARVRHDAGPHAAPRDLVPTPAEVARWAAAGRTPAARVRPPARVALAGDTVAVRRLIALAEAGRCEGPAEQAVPPGKPVRAPTPEAEPRSGDPLFVAVEVRGDVAVLRARGEVDLLTAPALHDELRIRLGHHLRVVLDLSEVRFLSAAGISAVVEAHRLARSAGGALHVTGAGHDCVRRPLALTRVDEILSVSTRSASALAAELGETAADVGDGD